MSILRRHAAAVSQSKQSFGKDKDMKKKRKSIDFTDVT